MFKFLRVFNIFAHIKYLYLNRKIKNHLSVQSKKRFGISEFINVIIFLLMISVMIYINIMYENKEILIGTIIISILIVFIIAVIIIRNKKREKISLHLINKIILKDEDGKNLKTWDIRGKTSLLIGKRNKNIEIDIDLSETSYAMLISREHAILNNVANSWYFEDIGSSNGSGIKRKNDGKKIKLKEGKLCKLNRGDIIYIANTQLLID